MNYQVGVLNGNWKQYWKLEPVSRPLSLRDQLDSARRAWQSVALHKLDAAKVAADVVEQLRLLDTITEDGETCYRLFGFDQETATPAE